MNTADQPSLTTALAAQDTSGVVQPLSIERRPLQPGDVLIDIKYCGICHTDLHYLRNDWGGSKYPLVPGHEIVGLVSAVGSDVSSYKVGDRVGVGCLVDSCGECASCKRESEQYCGRGVTLTYNSRDPYFDGRRTFGGYSGQIVVRQEFVVGVPESLDFAAAAPLLCAGITAYSPLRHHNAGPGTRVAVVGLGGIGNLAVRLAHSMGCHTTVVTTSESKREAALAAGAENVLISTDSAAMQAAAMSFDLILSTIPQGHAIAPYVELLDHDGALVLLGAFNELDGPLYGGQIIRARRSITGSMIGGIIETQEMLNYCAETGIVSEIELITPDQVNDALDKLASGEPAKRFVIDTSTLKN